MFYMVYWDSIELCSFVYVELVLTSVIPLKSWTGSSLPGEKANVHRAQADLSSKPAKSLYSPDNRETKSTHYVLNIFKRMNLCIYKEQQGLTLWLQFIQKPFSKGNTSKCLLLKGWSDIKKSADVQDMKCMSFLTCMALVDLLAPWNTGTCPPRSPARLPLQEKHESKGTFTNIPPKWSCRMKHSVVPKPVLLPLYTSVQRSHQVLLGIQAL